MIFALLSDEEAVQEEILGLPQSIALGVASFLAFAILLFIVTRLNQDR
jgi:hypothetical protein